MLCRPSFHAALALLVIFTSGVPVSGIVIDDFSVGPVVVNGPAVQDQTGLDPSHVIGGSRRIDVGRFGEGSRFEVADDQLQFSSTGRGYFTLTYGAVEPLGGVDFTQDGHDRLRIKLGEVVSNFHAMGVYVNLPAGSTSSGITWFADDSWDDITVEIPYSKFPVPFTAVQKIAVDASRNPAGTGFDIDSIITAGPSLAGDFNRDGLVDGADLTEWKKYVGVVTSVNLPYVIVTSDANADGRVDGADFLAWQRGLDITPSEAIAAPEPTCWSLMMLAAMAWRARSRRSRLSVG